MHVYHDLYGYGCSDTTRLASTRKNWPISNFFTYVFHVVMSGIALVRDINNDGWT